MNLRAVPAKEVWRVTRDHYFVINPSAYGQESCACGWRRDGWDAEPFEIHLARRLGFSPHDGLEAAPNLDESRQSHCPWCADEDASACAHEWLDRPESDTRECLLCGDEVAG
jgi:hypothetical protein